MRGNPFARLNVRLDKNVLEELRIRAAAEQVSISELVRMIIAEYLELYS